MDLIEDIGPILGVVAFLGFAILALLIVLQAREVRRLREWAGRAPERAVEADEAALTASDEKGELSKPERPSRLVALWNRIAAAVRPRWDEFDRRSPIDPRILVGLLAALIVAAVVTSGFGPLDSDEEPAAERRGGGADAIEVAVLNATEQPGLAEPVPGIADLVAKELVKPAGFAPGVQADAPAGEADSVIMFKPDSEADAEELAAAVEEDLGETAVEPMSTAVREQVKDAPLALLVGVEDRTFGEDAQAP